MSAPRLGAGVTAAGAGVYIVVLAAAIHYHRGLSKVDSYDDPVLFAHAPVVVLAATIMAIAGSGVVLGTVSPSKKNTTVVLMTWISLCFMIAGFWAVVETAAKRHRFPISYWHAAIGLVPFALAIVVSVALAKREQKLAGSSRRNANHVAPPNSCHWPTPFGQY